MLVAGGVEFGGLAMTMKYCSAIVLVLAGCGGGGGQNDTSSATLTTSPSGTDSASSSGDTGNDGPGNGPGNGPEGSDDGPEEGPDTKFDLGVNSDFCVDKDAGIYCDGTTAITCDGGGAATGTDNCLPDVCVDGEGCVTCLDGQFACHGPRVMSCNTAGAEPTWEEVEVCDSGASMACDTSVGTCVPLAPIGGIEPTGVYYQYAVFDLTGDGFSQISDVDTYEDRIYFVAMQGGGTLVVGRYDVELLDSDGDGALEPNQHPDNPEDMGPIEERVFTLVESWPANNPGAFPNVMELYAKADSVVYSGPNDLREDDFATHTITTVATKPAWLVGGYLSFLGYDDLNGVWYSGNESGRRVMQYDAESMTWGWSFQFPELAGSHMDGLEVVTDPETGTPYVYVSDMTSNFIGQYRHDTETGWTQENLFSYSELGGMAQSLEGFGFGALNHFWCGSLASTFYELGGGDIQEFVDPPG
jgi:hypothetical protein